MEEKLYYLSSSSRVAITVNELKQGKNNFSYLRFIHNIILLLYLLFVFWTEQKVTISTRIQINLACSLLCFWKTLASQQHIPYSG